MSLFPIGNLLSLIFLLLFPIYSAITIKSSGDHQCTVDYNPSVNGWKSGQGYCQKLGGRLCTRNEYCPNGRNTIPIGGLIKTKNHIRQWAPTSDGLNTWVLLTNFTNNNGHLGVISSKIYDTGTITGSICMHDDLTQSHVDWTSLSSGPQNIVVTCCDHNGVQSLDPCRSAATYDDAVNHCSESGLRLCTNKELQRSSITSTCCTGDCRKKRTWTSTPCTTSTLPSYASGSNPIEHSDQPCTLSSESVPYSTTSFDQIGETANYAILSVLPSTSSSTKDNMIDKYDETTYWEPGVDSGGEFLLDIGQTGLAATHIRFITTTTATSFDVRIESSNAVNDEA